MEKIKKNYTWIGPNGCNSILGLVEKGQKVNLKNQLEVAVLVDQGLIKEIKKSESKKVKKES